MGAPRAPPEPAGRRQRRPTYEVDVDNRPGIRRCLTFSEHSLPVFSLLFVFEEIT